MRTLVTLALTVAVFGCSGSVETPDDDGDAVELVEETGTTPSPDTGPMVTLELAESDSNPMNPERGYYVGYDLLGGGDAALVRAADRTLAIALVNLESYRSRDLDAELLSRLEAGFARVRGAGFKVILRFTYNSSFSADAPRERILGHLDQLAPLIQENADVIAVVQAGLIGAWGEWHASTNGLDNAEDRGAILDALLTAVPASRQVQVRTPMYKAEYLPGEPLDAAEAHSGSPRARLGHHNDCFLASADDYNTFAAPVADWKEYVAADGRFTAIGGETCNVYEPLTRCEAAMHEMETQHWSYLNREYERHVIAGWAEEGCDDEIERKLGYRFAVSQLAHSETVAPGGELAVEIDVANRGWAAPFNRRPVELVLASGASRHVVRVDGVDARTWAPGETTTVTARLRIPASMAPGTYSLAVRLPDESPSLAADPRHAIQLANDGVWVEDTGDNVLTTQVVVLAR
jgi:hypothetical protein